MLNPDAAETTQSPKSLVPHEARTSESLLAQDLLREQLEATRTRMHQVVTYVPQTPPHTNYHCVRGKSSSP